MRIPKKYKYCKICILPNTRPNLKLNSNGICNACDNNANEYLAERDSKWMGPIFEGLGTVSYTHLTLPTICSV